jgi:hypothetical protein
MRSRVIATALLALGATAAPASAGTWAKVSSDYNSNITIPSLIQSGSDVMMAWRLDTSPTTAEIDLQRFASTVAKPYTPSGPRTIGFAGWGSIDDPTLFATPSGIQIVTGGIKGTAPGDPIGMMLAPVDANGNIGATPARIGVPYGGQIDALSFTDGTPFFATNFRGTASVLRGVASPDALGVDLQGPFNSCCGYHPRLGLDAAGRLWLAWYSNATGHIGIYVQQVDPATGAGIGAPALAPGSESVNNNSFDTAFVCAASCRVVYGSSSGTALQSWSPGEAAATTVVSGIEVNAGPGRVVTAAYRSDGKLWVAWWDGSTYRYTLGDATGKGGQALDAGKPVTAAGFNGGAYALNALAVGNELVLATNWNGSLAANGEALFVNRVAYDTAPPATPAPGPRDVTVETAPGGKGFRIQVQYRVPTTCGKTCRAHAEIRTRSGARRFRTAAPKLPGDGPVVLGTRGTVKLPAGKKVRFYMTVSKAALLKTPFHTEGGFRVAETRLRVWLKTPKGEVLTVRDGRIKVSIARIRSGALPGLRGIL